MILVGYMNIFYLFMYLFVFNLTMLSVTREQACVASYGRIFSEYWIGNNVEKIGVGLLRL